MSFEEMVVAIIGTIAGVGLFGFIIARVTSVIQSWINRKKGGYDEETFNRLAKAFMQHKKDTERRLKNLEAIIADEDAFDSNNQISEPNRRIEIEEDEPSTEKQKGSEDSGNLRNILKH